MTLSAHSMSHPYAGARVLVLTATGDSEMGSQLEGCIGFLDWGLAQNLAVRPGPGKRNVINRTCTV
jgi:hypothetical protein